jgi:spermidine synthase
MATVIVELDREVIAEAAQMVGYWNSEEVLNRINMSEGFTLAALFDALHEHATADHIIREVWDGHGSRLSDEEYRARAEDLAHNEGDERFRFAPRRSWDD